MSTAEQQLRAALEATVAGLGTRALRAGVDRLMAAYRSGSPPERPVLATRADVLAYATYRMPATAAACGAAVEQLRAALPGRAPARVLDLGAGTGAASWAVTAGLPGVQHVVLLEQSAEAVEVGRALFGHLGGPALDGATWQRWRLTPDAAALPRADLAVAGYVLGELDPAGAAALTRLAAEAADVVLLVEPGTPAGYQRVLAARDQLLAAGLTIAAPCPHGRHCPLAGRDWCHFAERVARSAEHRRAKGAELSWEDEKFSFVAAVRDPAAVRTPAARVVRRPQYRKGLVSLELCAADGQARRTAVGRSQGAVYRRAREASWGDRWDADGDAVPHGGGAPGGG